eukprot:jgi/Mesen1/10324/ME000797S09806
MGSSEGPVTMTPVGIPGGGTRGGIDGPSVRASSNGVAFQVELGDEGGEDSTPSPSPSHSSPSLSPGLPKRLLERLQQQLEERSRAVATLDRIEAKLKEAHARRISNRELLASRVRAARAAKVVPTEKQRTELAQRLAARLTAAQQKRDARQREEQQRRADVQSARQLAACEAQSRLEQRTTLLARQLELRAARSHTNRAAILEAEMQRAARAAGRMAQSSSQRAEIARLDKERAAKLAEVLSQRMATAVHRREAWISLKRDRLAASSAQVRQVAASVWQRREEDRRQRRAELAASLERATGKRNEILRSRGSRNLRVRNRFLTAKFQKERLVRRLAKCWSEFKEEKKSTYALAQAFSDCHLDFNAATALPFDQLAERIASRPTLLHLSALLARFQTRLALGAAQAATPLTPGSSPPGKVISAGVAAGLGDISNIDSLLKQVTSPVRPPPGSPLQRQMATKHSHLSAARKGASVKRSPPAARHISSGSRLATPQPAIACATSAPPSGTTSAPAGGTTSAPLSGTISAAPVPRAATSAAAAPRGATSAAGAADRYPARVLLCAYMILTHPDEIFSRRGPLEKALADSAARLVPEFEVLVHTLLAAAQPAARPSLSPRPSPRLGRAPLAAPTHRAATTVKLVTTRSQTMEVLNSPETTTRQRRSAPAGSSPHEPAAAAAAAEEEAAAAPFLPADAERRPFKVQLAAFDSAWVDYLKCFVAWKTNDREELGKGLIDMACQLELSMLERTSALLPLGALSHDLQAIRNQVAEDQKLLQARMRQLAGSQGVASMEAALADVRSRAAEAESRQVVPLGELPAGFGGEAPDPSITTPGGLLIVPAVPLGTGSVSSAVPHATNTTSNTVPSPCPSPGPNLIPDPSLNPEPDPNLSPSPSPSPSPRSSRSVSMSPKSDARVSPRAVAAPAGARSRGLVRGFWANPKPAGGAASRAAAAVEAVDALPAGSGRGNAIEPASAPSGGSTREIHSAEVADESVGPESKRAGFSGFWSIPAGSGRCQLAEAEVANVRRALFRKPGEASPEVPQDQNSKADVGPNFEQEQSTYPDIAPKEGVGSEGFKRIVGFQKRNNKCRNGGKADVAQEQRAETGSHLTGQLSPGGSETTMPGGRMRPGGTIVISPQQLPALRAAAPPAPGQLAALTAGTLEGGRARSWGPRFMLLMGVSNEQMVLELLHDASWRSPAGTAVRVWRGGLGGGTTGGGTPLPPADENILVMQAYDRRDEDATWQRLEEDLSGPPPGRYATFLHQVAAIRDELAAVAPATLRGAICHSMDVDLLSQVLSASEPLNLRQVAALFDYAFETMVKLGSSAFESDARSAREKYLTQQQTTSAALGAARPEPPSPGGTSARTATAEVAAPRPRALRADETTLWADEKAGSRVLLEGLKFISDQFQLSKEGTGVAYLRSSFASAYDINTYPQEPSSAGTDVLAGGFTAGMLAGAQASAQLAAISTPRGMWITRNDLVTPRGSLAVRLLSPSSLSQKLPLTATWLEAIDLQVQSTREDLGVALRALAMTPVPPREAQGDPNLSSRPNLIPNLAKGLSQDQAQEMNTWRPRPEPGAGGAGWGVPLKMRSGGNSVRQMKSGHAAHHFSPLPKETLKFQAEHQSPKPALGGGRLVSPGLAATRHLDWATGETRVRLGVVELVSGASSSGSGGGGCPPSPPPPPETLALETPRLETARSEFRALVVKAAGCLVLRQAMLTQRASLPSIEAAVGIAAQKMRMLFIADADASSHVSNLHVSSHISTASTVADVLAKILCDIGEGSSPNDSVAVQPTRSAAAPTPADTAGADTDSAGGQQAEKDAGAKWAQSESKSKFALNRELLTPVLSQVLTPGSTMLVRIEKAIASALRATVLLGAADLGSNASRLFLAKAGAAQLHEELTGVASLVDQVACMTWRVHAPIYGALLEQPLARAAGGGPL